MSPSPQSKPKCSRRIVLASILSLIAIYAVVERFWFDRTPFHRWLVTQDDTRTASRRLRRFLNETAPIQVRHIADSVLSISSTDERYRRLLSELDFEVRPVSDWQQSRKFRAEPRASIEICQSGTTLFWIRGPNYVEFPEQAGERSLWISSTPVFPKIDQLLSEHH